MLSPGPKKRQSARDGEAPQPRRSGGWEGGIMIPGGPGSDSDGHVPRVTRSAAKAACSAGPAEMHGRLKTARHGPVSLREKGEARPRRRAHTVT